MNQLQFPIKNTETEDLDVEIQKKMISIFNELEIETKELGDKVSKKLLHHRNAYIVHINGDFNNVEQVIETEREWIRLKFTYETHSILLQAINKYLDSFYGYFPNYIDMKAAFDIALREMEDKEDYEALSILIPWRKKLP